MMALLVLCPVKVATVSLLTCTFTVWVPAELAKAVTPNWVLAGRVNTLLCCHDVSPLNTWPAFSGSRLARGMACRERSAVAGGRRCAGRRTHRSANLRRRPGATTARVRGGLWGVLALAMHGPVPVYGSRLPAHSFDCYAVCLMIYCRCRQARAMSRNILRHLVAIAAYYPLAVVRVASSIPGRAKPRIQGPAAATSFPLVRGSRTL